MKYSAVIFDLFGTLVDVPSTAGLRHELTGMAAVLGIPAETFIQLWFDTSHGRSTGAFPDVGANIRHITELLGVPPDEALVRKAVELRYAYTRRLLSPRPDAVDVIGSLKRAGHKIGLISGCSIDVPHVWPETPLCSSIDVAIFSCSVGMNKPDPRIYRLATDKLGVASEACLYVGDGANQELAGAARAGMHPVMIRVPYENADDANRPDADRWEGRVITALGEVLTLVD